MSQMSRSEAESSKGSLPVESAGPSQNPSSTNGWGPGSNDQINTDCALTGPVSLHAPQSGDIREDGHFHVRFFTFTDVKITGFTDEELKDEDFPNILDMTENDLLECLRPHQGCIGDGRGLRRGTVEPDCNTEIDVRLAHMEVRKPNEPIVRATPNQARILRERLQKGLTAIGSSMTLVEFAIELQLRLKLLRGFFEDEARKFVEHDEQQNEPQKEYEDYRNDPVSAELLNSETMEVLGQVVMSVIMFVRRDQFESFQFLELLARCQDKRLVQAPGKYLLIIDFEWNSIRKELGGKIPRQQVHMFPTVLYSLPSKAPSCERDICPLCCYEFEDKQLVMRLHCTHLYHINCAYKLFETYCFCATCRHDYTSDYMKQMATLEFV